jgi:hypothetical protein
VKRRPPNVFSLAFLDVIACGFGAVILFFMIINTGSTRENDERTQTLREEATRLEREALEGRLQLVVLRNSLEELEREQIEAEGRSRRVVQALRTRMEELAELEEDTLARTAHIEALKADLESLEEDTRRLEAGSHGREDRGEALRTHEGDADRQYLTGLVVGGERIFILVDASASMLDRTVVNIVRRRHLSDDQKRRSEKWRRAVATVDWLTTQIPAASRFQIYTFNAGTAPLIEGSEGRWLEARAPGTLNAAVDALRDVVPAGGTSLHHAFAALRAMNPLPDNVYLLTDGLPTRGEKPPRGTTVSPARRLSHFRKALSLLPPGVPVNVILYPMEGDPDAAISFWLLAQRSKGSLLSPSRDWP